MENMELNNRKKSPRRADKETVENLAFCLLRERIFAGTYQEKRYVERLNDYRDVIKICDVEKKLIDDLEHVLRRINKYYKNIWIGITNTNCVGAPHGTCLWTQLKEEIFGTYWFKIKDIHFGNNECCAIIEQLRPVDDINPNESKENLDLSATIQNIKSDFVQNAKLALINCLKVMTVQNTKDAIVFLSVLLAMLATSLMQGGKYFLEYFLILIDKFILLIHVMTPIIFKMLDVFMKIVGGFYILISIMWNGKRNNIPPQQHMQPQLEYRPRKYNEIYN